MRHLILAVFAATAVVAACKSESPQNSAATQTAAAPAPAHAPWTRKAVMYEVNVRQFTPEGTLAALQTHLPRLKQLGVDILWLMPVQPIGKKNRKGPLGSYYSIQNYTAVNPEFGGPADFRAFVDAAHQQGFKVVLDWVANHTAFDHAWTTEHPDWYVHRADGSISNALGEDGKETDWTDVAELNYDNREMRKAMIADMRFWLDSMKVDGLRCDVAWGVPMDFWTDARRELSQGRPDFFMLAESEGPKYYAAFDETYGWSLHHLMNEIAQKKQPVSALDDYLAKEKATYPPDAYRLYFTSNHDENSWNGTEFERMGANHAPAFVLSSTLQGGMPLIYTGQEASLKKRLKFFEKDTIDWKGTSLANFYSTLVALRHDNPALENGSEGGPQVKLSTDGGDRVYAFTRTKGANTVVVAVNFADTPAKVNYNALPAPGDYTDAFSKAKVTLAANGPLEIPANGYRVLVR